MRAVTRPPSGNSAVVCGDELPRSITSPRGVATMTFPVMFHLFGRNVHPHLVLELLAYTIGFQLFLLLRRKKSVVAGNASSRSLPLETMSWIIVGCVFGALFGSKILAWIES